LNLGNQGIVRRDVDSRYDWFMIFLLYHGNVWEFLLFAKNVIQKFLVNAAALVERRLKVDQKQNKNEFRL